MKIAVVLEAVFPADKGGLERWFFHRARGLSNLGHEVHYLNSAQQEGITNGVMYQSVTKYKWHYLEGGVRSIKQAFLFTLALCKWFYKEKYDAVYISSVPLLSIFSIPVVKVRNPKCKIIVEWLEFWPFRYWVSYKGLFVGLISWLVQFIGLQLGDYRTTFIMRTRNTIQKRNLPVNREQTIIMPGLVNENLRVSQVSPINRNDIVLLGRLVEEKQPVFAVQVISEYIRQGWVGTFWVIGTGPEESEIRRAILNSGYENQIQLLIDADDHVVRSKLNQSFLLFHPSKREGYGLVVVEAACEGTPTLLINYPENGAVDLGVNPRLVATDDRLSTILELIHYAERHKASLSAEAIEWAELALLEKTMTKTISKISEIASK